MDQVGTLSAHYHKHLQHFLRQIYVFLRYNLTDFYAKPGPSGVEFKGPLWHPVRYISPPSSDMAPHQGSFKWDHVKHVPTRAILLLEDLQVQEDSGFDDRYISGLCH